MFLLLSALFCTGVLRVGCFDLPNYIPKCSLSDPNINQCMVDKGNACLPRLMQGDATLAISSLSPLNASELVMEGNDLEMEWFGVYTDEIKNFRLKEFPFFIGPNTTSYYVGYLNHVQFTGENYNILSGNVAGIPAYGNGKFEVNFAGVTLNVTGTLTTYEKDDETYLDLSDVEATIDILHADYYFENIKSPCVDDVNAYIEDHWEEFTKQLKPAISSQLGAYSNYAVHMITTKIPVDKIFLP